MPHVLEKVCCVHAKCYGEMCVTAHNIAATAVQATPWHYATATHQTLHCPNKTSFLLSTGNTCLIVPHRTVPSSWQPFAPALSWWTVPSPPARSGACAAAHVLLLPWDSHHQMPTSQQMFRPYLSIHTKVSTCTADETHSLQLVYNCCDLLSSILFTRGVQFSTIRGTDFTQKQPELLVMNHCFAA